MVAYTGHRVSASTLIRGYTLAVARFRAAALERDPIPAFFACFEALNWAVAIDDLVAETWRPAGLREGYEWRGRVDGGEAMSGLRYVRNLVHHHWADALKLEEGARFPMRFPLVFFTWVWRASSELPPPTRKPDIARQPVYDELLADRRVEDTLFCLEPAFDSVRQLLEPHETPPAG